jgi:predicted phosphodiesterase
LFRSWRFYGIQLLFGFFLAFLGCRASEASALGVIEPYLLYSGNREEMTLAWRLPDVEKAALQWGTELSYSAGQATLSRRGEEPVQSHTMGNLEPGTRYLYRLNAGSETYQGSFITAPLPDTSDTTFFVYGDSRSHPEVHDRLAAAVVSDISRHPGSQTLVLHAGDLVNNGLSRSSWMTDVFDARYRNIRRLMALVPFVVSRGNHEGNARLFSRFFPYPYEGGRYWSLDYGPVHIAVVDLYTDFGPGSHQLAWLAEDLSSTNRPWKILIMHEPGWSAGHHENNAKVKAVIHPMALAHGVDVVFNGHNHYYARALVNGIYYITTGGGGAPLYDPQDGRPYVERAEKSHHYCRVSVAGDDLKLEAIGIDGDIIDTLVIRNVQ